MGSKFFTFGPVRIEPIKDCGFFAIRNARTVIVDGDIDPIIMAA